MRRTYIATLLNVCLAFLGVTSLASQSVLTKIEQPTEGYISTDEGLRLFYRFEGRGRERVVVVHGGPGMSMAALRPDLTPLAARRVVIYYDQRGGGRSTITDVASSINLDKHVDDLDAVRRFFDLERLLLIGHSWGAGLVAQYALRFPERVSRMLLVDPMPPRSTPYGEQFAHNRTAWMDAAARQQLDQLASAKRDAVDAVAGCRAYFALFLRGYFADPRRMSASRSDPCDNPPDALLNQDRVASLTLGPLGDWDWRLPLNHLRVPALVIHGAKDPVPLESAYEWAATLPNARILVIQGSGHFPFVEQPKKFFSATDELLAGRWPAGAVVGRGLNRRLR